MVITSKRFANIMYCRNRCAHIYARKTSLALTSAAAEMADYMHKPSLCYVHIKYYRLQLVARPGNHTNAHTSTIYVCVRASVPRQLFMYWPHCGCRGRSSFSAQNKGLHIAYTLTDRAVLDARHLWPPQESARRWIRADVWMGLEMKECLVGRPPNTRIHIEAST